MKNVSILDCTLRDGGYINDFQFGVKHIARIKEKLCAANIDIIECGFLRRGANDPERSLYAGVEQIQLPEDSSDMYVAMIAFGEISAEDIASWRPEYIDGIRLTFHNDEWEETKLFARDLSAKGYKVFIQPVGTSTYTDTQLLALIQEVNTLQPFAFYIVDTLGSMYANDLLRIFFLVDHNLDGNISLGFHSHNNMQLSFANAMALLELHTNRHIIIDSSVFGMGRGAGNLNTELITHFINDTQGDRYSLLPLLELIDDIILPIYKYTPWGFSEPYYLSAIMGIHPNYATYLIDKQSISMTKIAGMLEKLPKEKRHLFEKHKIDDLYHAEMSNVVEDSVAVAELAEKIGGRKVLLIAPGISIKTYSAQIQEFIKTARPFIISLNFVPEDVAQDIVFISNRKRFEQLNSSDAVLAVTSNIDPGNKKNIYIIDYDSLILEKADSSGIMALRFLMRLGVKEVALAGFDGFTGKKDHYSTIPDSYLSTETIASLNDSMNKNLSIISQDLSLQFITPSVYEIALDG